MRESFVVYAILFSFEVASPLESYMISGLILNLFISATWWPKIATHICRVRRVKRTLFFSSEVTSPLESYMISGLAFEFFYKCHLVAKNGNSYLQGS